MAAYNSKAIYQPGQLEAAAKTSSRSKEFRQWSGCAMGVVWRTGTWVTAKFSECFGLLCGAEIEPPCYSEQLGTLHASSSISG